MTGEKMLEWIRLSLGGAVIGHSVDWLCNGPTHPHLVGAMAGTALAALAVRVFRVVE